MKINDLPPLQPDTGQYAPRIETGFESGDGRTRGKTVEEVKKAANQDLEQRVQEEVDDFNETVESFMVRDLKFQLHRDSDRLFVQVIDVIHDEVISEMPPEEFLDMVAKIQDMVGIILDELV